MKTVEIVVTPGPWERYLSWTGAFMGREVEPPRDRRYSVQIEDAMAEHVARFFPGETSPFHPDSVEAEHARTLDETWEREHRPSPRTRFGDMHFTLEGPNEADFAHARWTDFGYNYHTHARRNPAFRKTETRGVVLLRKLRYRLSDYRHRVTYAVQALRGHEQECA